MVSSRVVDFFLSERDQRGLQVGHQGKRLSAARRDSIVNSSPCFSSGKEKQSKEKTRQKHGDVSILLHGGRQCSGLFTGLKSSLAASTRQGFKEGKAISTLKSAK
ncbi:hypothetical protein PIB30_081154, partial [Stylosanthes scabra]|nr:hypothetical protein [Stylosanthes scabra]